jgi:hypothetical protein
VSLVVLLAAIAYSKRDSGGLDAEIEAAPPVEEEAAPATS